jgi:hypothetical protein
MNKKSVHGKLIFCIFSIIGGIFLIGNIVNAADLKIFDRELEFQSELNLIPDDFVGVTNLTLVDLGGDGQSEIVVTYGETDWPILKIFRVDGSLVNSWHPYPRGFTGEIVVTSADFDNDGKEEIVTGAGAGGGAQVRVFDGYGEPKFVPSFFAREKDYRQGIKVAVGNIDENVEKEIIVSSIYEDGAMISFFDRYGKEVKKSITIELVDNFEAPNIETIDLGEDNVEEILVGLSSGNKPEIRMIRLDGSLINSFNVYGETFLGGVNFTVVDSGDENLIITGAGFSGGPHVRFVDGFGKVKIDPAFFSHDRTFRGGVRVAYGDITGDGNMELLAMPQYSNSNGYLHKYIDIDISEQKMRTYQSGRLLNEYLISSGLKGMDTPLGEFSIWQKNPRAYSATYELFMPFWMSFKPKYGIHELPEWASGHKEGEDHLGRRASHGCVRLGIGSAEEVYRFAPIGTKVIIHE